MQKSSNLTASPSKVNHNLYKFVTVQQSEINSLNEFSANFINTRLKQFQLKSKCRSILNDSSISHWIIGFVYITVDRRRRNDLLVSLHRNITLHGVQ